MKLPLAHRLGRTFAATWHHRGTILIAAIVSLLVHGVLALIPNGELRARSIHVEAVMAKDIYLTDGPGPGPMASLSPTRFNLSADVTKPNGGSITLENEKGEPEIEVMGTHGDDTEIVRLAGPAEGPCIELKQRSYLVGDGYFPAALTLGAVSLESHPSDGRTITVVRPAPSLVLFD